MSNTLTYNETLVFFIDVVKTTPANNKPVFNGQLAIGTNSSITTDTSIAPAATLNGVGGSQILAVFCDGPLAITYNNGLTSFTTIINSVAILPGNIAQYTLTNNGDNTVNVRIIAA